MSEALATAREVAAFLKLSVGVVRQMGREGTLTEYRVGPNRGRVRYAMDEVRAHAEGGRARKPQPQPQAARHKPRLDRMPDGSDFRHI